MKICYNCNIKFNTYNELCPLCQNKLQGKANNCLFPKKTKKDSNNLVLKILLFFSLAISIIVSFLELKINNHIKYSLYVYISLITNYHITRFIIKNHHNILKMFLKYGFILNTLILAWYFITQTTIITNYIIPSICLFELIFNFIICIVLKENYFLKYSNLIIINILLLILPTILVLCKQTTNSIMSNICLMAALISIIALIIFFNDNIKEEIHKIFNL